MKLHIKNLGPIKEATIDLSKRFYTFVGYNNTGKTYLANVLWGVFDGTVPAEYFDVVLKEMNYSNEDYKKHIFNVSQEDLDKIIIPQYTTFIKNIILTEIFHADTESERFKNLFLKFDVDTNIFRLKENLADSRESKEVEIKDNKLVFYIEYYRDTWASIQDILECLFPFAGGNIDFLGTDRLSYIASLQKNIRKFTKEGYPMLRNFLEDIYFHSETISMSKKERAEYIKEISTKYRYADLANKLKLIMQGKPHFVEGIIERNADFFFQIKGNEEILPLNVLSKSINQLFLLYMYFQYSAQEYSNFLFIDEPEQNLHPENQVKITELLIQFANRNNNRVLICTHSPLIAEVINNYLVLGQLENREEARENLGLAENCFLTPEDTGIYFFTGDKVREYKISDYGTIFEDFKAAQEKVWRVGNDLGDLMYEQLKKKRIKTI